MTKEDNIIVPHWFLEVVEDTLRIENNINEPYKKETGESCQDRNIRQSLNGIRKLLKGEELTGMERLEKLQPSPPSNLDEVAEEYERNLGYYECVNQWPSVAFTAGAEWMAGQFQKIDGSLVDWYETNGVEYCHGISTNESFEVPEGFYIKKK